MLVHRCILRISLKLIVVRKGSSWCEIGFLLSEEIANLSVDVLVSYRSHPGTTFHSTPEMDFTTSYCSLPTRVREFLVLCAKELTRPCMLALLFNQKEDSKEGILVLGWGTDTTSSGTMDFFPRHGRYHSHSNSDVENAFGDNDPVDVVQIGGRQAKMGEVLKVKPLAVLAMIDKGELDWKVVAISVDDPKADLVNNVADDEKHFPGTLTAIRDWFRDYKIPDGKPANRFGLDNKPADKDYALNVIAETNEAWAKLPRVVVSSHTLGKSVQPDLTLLSLLLALPKASVLLEFSCATVLLSILYLLLSEKKCLRSRLLAAAEEAASWIFQFVCLLVGIMCSILNFL